MIGFTIYGKRFQGYCALLLSFVLSSNIYAQESEIKLEDWNLELENKVYKVSAVPWETEIAKGGTGRKEYDGIGIYQIRFYVPFELKDHSLAFYSDSIDDADETFLNGRLIGQTGIIPKAPSKTLIDFRAAPREARLYPLPNLKFGKENEIKIRVYDYAGLGGLSPKQTPVIGTFQALQARERNHRLLSDLPRTVGGSFLLIFFFSYLFHFFNLSQSIQKRKILESIVFPFSNYFSKKDKQHEKNFSIETYISARYLLSALFCFFSLFFLFSELTYKYLLIESEEFYFKIPTLGFALGQFVLQLLFYPDVFGRRLMANENRVISSFKILLSIVSHPFWTVLFFCYLFFLPPNRVWNEFTVNGVLYLFFIISILFVGSAYNLIQVGNSKNATSENADFRIQGFTRILLFIGMLISLIIWFFSPTLYPFSFLIMILFLMAYMIVSLGFIVKNRILLPIEPIEIFPIFTIVQRKYNVTYSEAEIIEAIYHGLSRSDIKKKMNIKEENLKKYLNSIYKKVFNHHKNVGTTGRDKLQRLTMILHTKINRNKPEG